MPHPIDELDLSYQRRAEELDQNAERFNGGLEPETYAALFQTDLGLLVLEDLYREFSAVTRWAPGEPSSAGYYREGASSVVDFIQHKLAAHNADNSQ